MVSVDVKHRVYLLSFFQTVWLSGKSVTGLQVDVKHHVYLLIFCQTVWLSGKSVTGLQVDDFGSIPRLKR